MLNGLIEKISQISNPTFTKGLRLFSITVNKENPLGDKIVLSIDDQYLKDANIILVDDVINSGKTLIHSVSRILTNKVNCIKTAVLVNRTHRRFPISANFVGLNVSTTLQDNIIVEFGKNETAYLV